MLRICQEYLDKIKTVDYDQKSVDYLNSTDNRLNFFKMDHLEPFQNYSLSKSMLYLECTSYWLYVNIDTSNVQHKWKVHTENT